LQILWVIINETFHLCTSFSRRNNQQKRVLNDLWRAMLSRGRTIWFLAQTLPPSPVGKLDRRHTGRVRKRDNLQHDGRGGRRGWARSRIIRPQEGLATDPRVKKRCRLYGLTNSAVVYQVRDIDFRERDGMREGGWL
jgi:hypothetical protein